jgi:dephospho-CoA kinase
VSRSGRAFTIGVTGDIACGKSTVLRMLADFGAETIDADAVYHELIAPGAPLWQALLDRFGDDIVGPGGAIDRQALGAIVFADQAALADLDALTHPAIVAEVQARIEASAAPVVALDAVKLIESGLAADCDRVWIVTCDRDQQIARLVSRNGLSRAEAERRIGAQPPLAPKLAQADLVIDNSGSLDATRRQVEQAWQELPRPLARSPRSMVSNGK